MLCDPRTDRRSFGAKMFLNLFILSAIAANSFQAQSAAPLR